MHDVLFFISGSIFTLILLSLCLLLALKITEYKEETEFRREKKRKEILKNHTSRGGVLIPKTAEERRLEKDEEFQAFKDLVDQP